MHGSCVCSHVIPIQRNISYSFRTVSFCMHNTEIRLSTANKNINEWEHFKYFIVTLSIVNSAEDYKNLPSRDGEYCESVELACTSHLFSNYLFRVHYKNSTNTIDFGCTYYVFFDAFCITYILRIF